jgi:hypothetical protein
MRLALLLVLAACHDSRPVESAPVESKPTAPSPVPAGSAVAEAPNTSVTHLSVSSGDGALAGATTLEYVRSLAVKDWPAVCATWMKSQRDEMARIAGTCERAMETMFAKQPVEIFATVMVRDVRKRADTIAVDVVQPGQTTPVGTFTLRKEGSDWLLVDLPDDQSF